MNEVDKQRSSVPIGRDRLHAGSGLHARVVDTLGQEIVDEVLPVGSILLADELCARFGVSRSVVREAVRTLSSMGLVQPRPQIGTRVLSSLNWDLLNPQVVRWRGLGPKYLEQMKELLELRLGVEVAAAGLAAALMTEGESTRLIACVDGMDAALTDNDPYRFFAFDVEFHRRLLEGSGNAVIAQLADTIEITLAARGKDTRPGMHHITAESIERHRQLALAIARRDPDTAGQTARMLVLDTLAEFERLLAAQN